MKAEERVAVSLAEFPTVIEVGESDVASEGVVFKTFNDSHELEAGLLFESPL